MDIFKVLPPYRRYLPPRGAPGTARISMPGTEKRQVTIFCGCTDNYPITLIQSHLWSVGLPSHDLVDIMKRGGIPIEYCPILTCCFPSRTDSVAPPFKGH